jgi:hypothetical protein
VTFGLQIRNIASLFCSIGDLRLPRPKYRFTFFEARVTQEFLGGNIALLSLLFSEAWVTQELPGGNIA